MAALLQLLGQPRFYKEGKWLDLPPKQPLLLCAYLACYENWVDRSEIINLFWPEEHETKGRHNLSQLLYHCKKQVWAQGLETERLRVRWLISSDVQELREALANGNWSKVVELYRGELLEKIPAGELFDYEEWLNSERETLYRAWKDAVLKEVSNLEANQQHQSATDLLQKILQRDFLDENVLQLYMRNAARAGQRQQALKSFDEFSEQLRQEFDMEPLEHTRQLASAIKNNELTITIEADSAEAILDKPTSLEVSSNQILQNLPSQLTTFIGRDKEIAEFVNLLADPNIRLLTLLGAGGIGKTSLAIQAARGLVQDFC